MIGMKKGNFIIYWEEASASAGGVSLTDMLSLSSENNSSILGRDRGYSFGEQGIFLKGIRDILKGNRKYSARK